MKLSKQHKGISDLEDYTNEVWGYLHYTHQGFMRTDSGKKKRGKYDTSSDLVAMALIMAYRKDIGLGKYITQPKNYSPSGNHGVMVWNHTLNQISNTNAYDVIDLIIGRAEQDKYWREHVSILGSDTKL